MQSDIFFDWAVYHACLHYAGQFTPHVNHAAYAFVILTRLLPWFVASLAGRLGSAEPNLMREQTTVVSHLVLSLWYFIPYERKATTTVSVSVLLGCILHECFYREDNVIHQCLSVVCFFACLLFFAGFAARPELQHRTRLAWLVLLRCLGTSLAGLLAWNIYRQNVNWAYFLAIMAAPWVFPEASVDLVGVIGADNNALGRLLVGNGPAGQLGHFFAEHH